MKYHRQKFGHDPEAGIFGDCFRTAVACILDLEIDEVPHVLSKGESPEEATAGMRRFLAERGLTWVDIPFSGENTLEHVLHCMAHWNPGLRYTLTGLSTTGVGHVVVCLHDRIEHDPHGDAGIVGPIEGHYWVGLIGKLT